MTSPRFVVPALLLFTWCQSAAAADAPTGARPGPPDPAAEEAWARFQEQLGLGASTDASGAGQPTNPKNSRAKPTTPDDGWPAEPKATADQEWRQARIAQLRARLEVGDSSVVDELRDLLIAERSGGASVTTTTTMTGTMTPEQARSRIAELRARAAAGDPAVTVTRRSGTGSPQSVEMTEEERARRQAYVAAHPDLPPRTKAQLLAGLFVLAMKFEDVEQLLGPLQPAEDRLPAGADVAPDVKVYTTQQNGHTVYLLFRDGKLVRR